MKVLSVFRLRSLFGFLLFLILGSYSGADESLIDESFFVFNSNGSLSECEKLIQMQQSEPISQSQVNVGINHEELYPDLEVVYSKVVQFLKESNKHITLVIPAYEEEHRIEDSILRVSEFIKTYPLPIQVLYIVEKSKDKTIEVGINASASQPQIHIIDNQVHRGKGYAVGSGVAQSKGDYVFFTDLDLATPLPELIYFMNTFIDNNVDIIIGKRIRDRDQRAYRKITSQGFHFLVEHLFGIPGDWDTQCGFKGFKCHTAKDLFSKRTINGFSFDLEILMLSQMFGYQVQSQPVHWFNDDKSKVNVWIEPFKMLKDLIKVKKIINDQKLAGGFFTSYVEK